MQALEAALLETAAAGEKDGRARGEVRESIGAVDETFLEHMILVFMECIPLLYRRYLAGPWWKTYEEAFSSIATSNRVSCFFCRSNHRHEAVCAGRIVHPE